MACLEVNQDRYKRSGDLNADGKVLQPFSFCDGTFLATFANEWQVTRSEMKAAGKHCAEDQV
jgi:hypothetical protein